MQEKDFVPQHPKDVEAIQRLRNTSKEEVVPYLGELLKWMQDPCWPISHSVSQILKQYSVSLVPYIREVLRSDDGQWKISVLGDFVWYNQEVAKALLVDLENVAENPTPNDREYDVHLLCNEILEKYGDR